MDNFFLTSTGISLRNTDYSQLFCPYGPGSISTSDFKHNSSSILSVSMVDSLPGTGRSTSVSEGTLKGAKEMSIVGFVLTDQHIIPFCDGKSSVRDVGYKFREQEGRKDIQKLWYNDRFLCLSHGTNEFPSRSEDGRINTIRLEDYIPTIIDNAKTPEELVRNIFSELRNKCLYPKVDSDNPLCFVFLLRRKNAWIQEDAVISTDNYQIKGKEIECPELTVAGNSWYQNHLLNRHEKCNLFNYSPLDMRKLLDDAEKIYDLEMNGMYNPVGGRKMAEYITLSDCL